MENQENIYKRKKDTNFLLIILGVIVLIGIGGAVFYFATSKSTEQKSPSNIEYLPNEEESQRQIQEIKTAKNLDDQQATIEFLTRYVPQLNWWEINSLSELDEKINLVNNKTGFPPFSVVPSVDKFNQEFSKAFAYKQLLFLASVLPRESDGSIDWKGLDFPTYCLTIFKPLAEQEFKFKPAFATQDNYQKLGQKIDQEINPSLVSICSGFGGLSQLKELNELTNNYLNKIFQGNIYAEAIHDSLAEQLAISGHQKYTSKTTGNSSDNFSWSIALNEFAFKQENSPA